MDVANGSRDGDKSRKLEGFEMPNHWENSQPDQGFASTPNLVEESKLIIVSVEALK